MIRSGHWPYLIIAILILGGGYLTSFILGPALAPPPHEVAGALIRLTAGGEMQRDLSITVARATGGLILANILGVFLGLLAGLIPSLWRVSSPLITAVQACPTFVWISLALVWVGTGSAVPVAAVFAATLPPLFAGAAQGVMSIDRRALAMSRLYGVPWHALLRRLLLPSLLPFWLAAFSHTLAAGWKVAAMAEFIGSSDGVGTRIYWAYRRMDTDDLFAWALSIIALGVILEYTLASPLRLLAARRGKTSTSMEISRADS